jgi:hypothetical protein
VAKPIGKLRDSTRAEIIEDAATIIVGGAFSIAAWVYVGTVIRQLLLSLF